MRGELGSLPQGFCLQLWEVCKSNDNEATGVGESSIAWVLSPSLLPAVPGSHPLLKDAQKGGSALGWSVVPTPRLGQASLGATSAGLQK